MTGATSKRLLETLKPDDVVLDIGGWADPLPRADWVMDMMPHESRGLYERQGWRQAGVEEERFTADTWVVRDLCDREPFPFDDDHFDFVTCSHTLEDLRDPIWVASEIARIGKAGYIEVPSRLEEQSWGVTGPYVGWPHHHWLIEDRDGELEFVFKQCDLQTTPEWTFPFRFFEQLDIEDRVVCFWWEGSFVARERYLFEEGRPASYFSDFVVAERSRRPLPKRPVRDAASRVKRQVARRASPS